MNTWRLLKLNGVRNWELQFYWFKYEYKWRITTPVGGIECFWSSKSYAKILTCTNNKKMLIVFNYKRVTYPLIHHNITLNKIDSVNIEPKFGNSKWLQRHENFNFQLKLHFLNWTPLAGKIWFYYWQNKPKFLISK